MDGSELVEKLQYNTKHFRKRMQEAGFTLKVHGTGLGLLCCLVVVCGIFEGFNQLEHLSRMS